MKDRKNASQPTATVALSRFEEICKSLSVEDLQRSVEAISWDEGLFIHSNRTVDANSFLSRENHLPNVASALYCIISQEAGVVTTSCYIYSTSGG